MKAKVTKYLVLGLLVAFLATTAALAAPSAVPEKPDFNWHVRDIVGAAVLSHLSDSSFEDIFGQIQDQGLAQVLDNLGVDQDQVRRAMAKILHPKAKKVRYRGDLYLVRTLAELSGKSVEEIREMKTDDNTWQDIAQQLGLDWEEVAKEIRQNVQILKGKKVRHRTGLYLVRTLAELSGKSVEEVREMKTEDNTWQDVAQQLGLDWEEVAKQIRQNVHRSKDIHTARRLAAKLDIPLEKVLELRDEGKNWREFFEILKGE